MRLFPPNYVVSFMCVCVGEAARGATHVWRSRHGRLLLLCMVPLLVLLVLLMLLLVLVLLRRQQGVRLRLSLRRLESVGPLVVRWAQRH